MKLYLYIVLNILLFCGAFGALLPYLISEESDISVIIGVSIIIVMPVIFYKLLMKIYKELKK